MTYDRETEITRRLSVAAGSLMPDDIDGLYEYANQEVNEGRMVTSLGAEAKRRAAGVEEQCRALYLAARVNKLRIAAEEQLLKERQG